MDGRVDALVAVDIQMYMHTHTHTLSCYVCIVSCQSSLHA